MQVIKPRASLLSNYEVLDLLRELESDYLLKSKTAVRVKKEDEAAGVTAQRNYDPLEDISENLRTMEVEAIQYLSADYQPTRMQTPQGIAQLVKSITPYGLTKPEKLQIVNLAPTEAVELYVIVEELEDRLGETMQEVLDAVQASLTQPVSASAPQDAGGAPGAEVVIRREEMEVEVYEEDAQWDHAANDVEFVDAGEGAGVEGDLDLDDD
ncbi:hypothetical protein EWM64_g10366 [Hericium alpestre]|uniref:DNA-directed RNA polymerase III subunit RPC9 n=1 Tax=Hericium alpestre TaxID=135208 RepID=A0A4Y9ZFW4_9AGAM|nr:hypothetical protein EWM64_g10366 [Hericium alpestre]